MQSVGRPIFGFIAALFLVAVAFAARQNSQPPATAAKQSKAVLVELFTSEGCSSCPPADELLREINGKQTSAGQLIVGISEHVTYWNSLGWSDPYSSDIYTTRQNSYGKRFGLDSVYTPQMVVNGSEEFVGSDRTHLNHAILRQSAQDEPIALQILSVHVDGSMLSFRFTANGEFPKEGADIVAVIADDADRSSVLRGENSGRALAHVAVARSLQKVASVTNATEKTVQMTLPRSLQASEGHHLILFAQIPGYGRVLGTDTAHL